jgi:hypothetical protein
VLIIEYNTSNLLDKKRKKQQPISNLFSQQPEKRGLEYVEKPTLKISIPLEGKLKLI